ncbi:hypothetical protein K493DRAFT_65448 [Basidiobolus meristosporus CBS 931.73]|uniref:Arrestin C-terminal-like domain-containing protein n=1 Tax=Basidiobolus meristosporus CBS 931.73 TaxID=1314790 RepID=A0A1Y1XVJ4_9FUNG|nr:hypothetical protein K493DRAFT_65448 [Basidiobolus meristosporus CBS 931.73]|eukprot:ORX89780.1 hypothetical protein K493DRAFT_65448 [Basidiobolus meristosporus CBS 931.73]
MSRNTSTKYVILQFIGEITTSLMSLTERKFNETQTVTLFNTELILFGTRNSDTATNLSIGEHKFPFEFHLPATSSSFSLPTCYLGNKGSIQYTLRATHHKPWIPTALSPRCVCPVLVSDFVDSQDPIYLTPLEETKEAILTLGTFRKSKGPVKAKVFIPKKAFTKGEIIPVKISISHIQPIRDANGIHVKLLQLSSFMANGYEQKQASVVFAQDLAYNVDSTSLSTTAEAKLRIPHSLPPTTIKSPLISFSYEIHVKVDLVPSTFHKKRLEYEFPLVVGTYPIMGESFEEDEVTPDITDYTSHAAEEEGDWTVVLPYLTEDQELYDISGGQDQTLAPEPSIQPSTSKNSFDLSRASSHEQIMVGNGHSRRNSSQNIAPNATFNPEPSAPHMHLMEKPPLDSLTVEPSASTSTPRDSRPSIPSAPSALDLGYMVDEAEEVPPSQETEDDLPPSYQEALRAGASQHWQYS